MTVLRLGSKSTCSIVMPLTGLYKDYIVNMDGTYFNSRKVYELSHQFKDGEKVDFYNTVTNEQTVLTINDRVRLFSNYVCAGINSNEEVTHKIHFIGSLIRNVGEQSFIDLIGRKVFLECKSGVIEVVKSLDVIILTKIKEYLESQARTIQIETVEDLYKLRDQTKQKVIDFFGSKNVYLYNYIDRLNELIAKTFKMFKKDALEFNLKRPEYTSNQPEENTHPDLQTTQEKQLIVDIKKLTSPIIKKLKKDPKQAIFFKDRGPTVDKDIVENVRNLAMNLDGKLERLLEANNGVLKLCDYIKDQGFHQQSRNGSYLRDLTKLLLDEGRSYIKSKYNEKVQDSLTTIWDLFKEQQLFTFTKLTEQRGHPAVITWGPGRHQQ